jgi:drug/metabolite transporter (DMT)-like permease
VGGDLLIFLHFTAAGLQSTATRAASREQMDAATLAFATALTTLVIAGAMLLFLLFHFPDVAYSPEITPVNVGYLVLIFLGIGAVYSLTHYARFHSHKVLPSYIFEPLSRAHILIVVPISMIFIESGSTTTIEWLAIAAALVPVAVLSRQNPRKTGAGRRAFRNGVWLVLLASICAAGLQLLSKYLVDPKYDWGLPVLVFIVGSNAASAVVAMLRHLSGQPSRLQLRATIRYGLLCGFFNVVALGSLLLFLVDGKPSRIYSVGAMSMLIPVAWALLARRERMPTRIEWVAFGSAGLAILLQVQMGEG